MENQDLENITIEELVEKLSNDIINIEMPTFEDLSTTQLKQVIRNYNLHYAVKGYSKLKREELIELCLNMFHMDNKGIKLKNAEPIIFKVPEHKKQVTNIPIKK